MLKDIISNYFKVNKNIVEDKINFALTDGYVDIKGYLDNPDGTKRLVYHDAGDNTVTDWMRQAIIMLLSGNAFSCFGNNSYVTCCSGCSCVDNKAVCFTAPYDDFGAAKGCACTDYQYPHSEYSNVDGYILNGGQYLWCAECLACKPVKENYACNITYNNESPYHFSYFPTKVLFGTGVEFNSWSDLCLATCTQYNDWFQCMTEIYSNGENTQDAAATNFNNLVAMDDNIYSGTVGASGNYSASCGNIIKTVTVNDPDSTSCTTSTTDMATRVGVVGAVKTLYTPYSASSCTAPGSSEGYGVYLDSSISEEGRLISGIYRGGGKPCFLYFNRNMDENGNIQEDWSDSASAQIYLTKDSSSSEFLNRITFRMTLPSQSAGSGAVGKYYPYNGYTLKQVGLYNDAIMADDTCTTASISNNMPNGMLLAVKNIQAFSKTADATMVLTWTLTI